MFKKGVITDEISQDLDCAARMAAEFGLQGLEIRSVWEKAPQELDESDIARIIRIARQYGLEICGISSPFFKCNLDDAFEVENQLDILDKCIALAKALDCSIVRGFTFWRQDRPSAQFEQTLPLIAERYAEPVRRLEAAGVTLAIEFEPAVNATNARKVRAVVEAIGSKSVQALWDPGNSLYDIDGEKPFPDGYEIIKPYMAHMHLKDTRKLSDGTKEGAPIGDGEVGYYEHFHRLLDDGYEGWVALETHYRPKHHIDESLIKMPKGSSFSHLGDIASRECLIKWNALMERILSERQAQGRRA